ncbi:MAG: DNA repair protein, partial [Spirochaetales bacterium]|nr:DNA repair protein [Spirochaetales bacterium]
MVKDLYDTLLETYGPQGWWPLSHRIGEPGFTSEGYHPGVFPVLREEDRFHIVTGAVLTQNTAWKNVRKALTALEDAKIRRAEDLAVLPLDNLSQLIRPSGYYNQKAKKLQGVMGFFLRGGHLKTGIPPERPRLLNVWGIGPETVDSILLYAFDVPVFVVDAYTFRLWERFFGSSCNKDYHALQESITRELPRDARVYQEFHALIV